MEKSQNSNRSTILIVLAALVIIVGVVVWTTASSLLQPGTTVAAPQLISPAAYQEQFGADSEHALIDVRTPEEFNSGHIPGAVNINVETLPARLDEVPEGIPIVVYCRTGNRSATAARILVDAGFSPVYDLGGIQDWVAAGYSTN